MNRKTRSIIKVIAIVLVILVVAVRLISEFSLPYLNDYNTQFWLVIIAFGLALISSR